MEMNRFITCCALVFGCLVAFVSAPASAYAATQSHSADLLPTAPGFHSTEELEFPRLLPTSLASWGGEDPALIPAFPLPQARKSIQPSFIDFDKFEAGGFMGVVTYSADFKANTDIIGGLVARVPVPGL